MREEQPTAAGNVEAGAVGSLASPATGVLSGGVATIIGAALISVALPAFARYRRPAADDSTFGAAPANGELGALPAVESSLWPMTTPASR